MSPGGGSRSPQASSFNGGMLDGMGGAFSGQSGTDNLSASFMPTQNRGYNDPRMEECIFENMPINRPAASSSAMQQLTLSRGQMQPPTVAMSRNLSNHRSGSSHGYAADGHREPVRGCFAETDSGQLMFSTPNGVSSSVYREPQHGTSSYTGSAYSQGRNSHRSSDASNNFPGTPLTDYGANLENINLSGSPSFRDTYGTRDNAYPAAVYNPSDNDGYIAASSMTRVASARSQKEKRFWCEIASCQHGRAFGTRNDLDRHKLAVHKIIPAGGNTKVFICLGASCQQQGKNKVWPRKDNFKNHCKVAHPENDLDDLIQRSERLAHTLKPKELEGLQAEESTTAPEAQHAHRPSITIHTALDTPPSNILPPPSPDYLTPISPNGARQLYSHRRNQMERSQSVSSAITAHRRSVSAPDSSVMTRNASDPATNSSLSASLGPLSSVEDVMAFLRSQGIPQNIVNSALAAEKHGVKRRSDGREVSEAQRHVCDRCHKEFKRPCDLKKHFTRHTKPWGCTNSSCHKIFGSKNDWKRHENLRHFQVETWICGVTAPANLGARGARCTRMFTDREKAVKHYREHYPSASLQEIQAKLKRRRIGRNWEGAFWCGFCEEVISLKHKNLDAWDERFDHIDSHLFGRFSLSPEQKQNYPDLARRSTELASKTYEIGEWIPPNTDKTKAELKWSRVSAASSFESQSVDFDEDGDGDDEDDEPACDDDDAEDLPPAQAFFAPSASDRPSKKPRTEYTWMCSACGTGPMKMLHNESCFCCTKHRSDEDELTEDIQEELGAAFGDLS